MKRKDLFLRFDRMLIEKESPEEYGYQKIRYNLSESSIAYRRFSELEIDLSNLSLGYGSHNGKPEL